jgi:hypothetical protein
MAAGSQDGEDQTNGNWGEEDTFFIQYKFIESIMLHLRVTAGISVSALKGLHIITWGNAPGLYYQALSPLRLSYAAASRAAMQDNNSICQINARHHCSELLMKHLLLYEKENNKNKRISREYLYFSGER